LQRVVPILAGAGFTVAISTAAGLVLIRRLRLAFDWTEEVLFGFVSGSAIVSFLVFLLCCIHQARLPVFLALGVVAVAGVWRSKPLRITQKWQFSTQKWVFLAVVLPLFFVYLTVSVAPEVSPDGSGYHLGNVTRMYESRGFTWEYHSIYAHLSQGTEMLFLVAFSIGGMSAAATVHLAFLCALGFLIACFGRRFGHPRAGMFAAVLVFASPVVGLVGSAAYVDVALATCIFTVFYLAEVELQESNPKRLILIWISAGFCYAIKYPGGLALPLVLLLLRGKGVSRIVPAAALIAVPWMLRNWFWLGNPFAPFHNRWFPNPFYSAESEASYLRDLRHIEGFHHWWEIPLDMTVFGAKLPGFLGPVFLLSPFLLLALRHPLGRRLILAAFCFAIPAVLNPGVRFLIPALSFVALAMGVAMENSPGVLLVVAVCHAFLALPAVMSWYCPDWAWRIKEVPWRIDPVAYVNRHSPETLWLKQELEENTSKSQKIYSLAGLQEAYINRWVVVSYESEEGLAATRALSRPDAGAELRRMGFAIAVLNQSLKLADATLIGQKDDRFIYRLD
jgi:hypothetical protein